MLSYGADDDDHKDREFHHNEITPGTEFFEGFTKHLEHFIRHKLSTDPKWQSLTIILSGSNVPGEGEHKIMDFMRKEKYRNDQNRRQSPRSNNDSSSSSFSTFSSPSSNYSTYHPNLRHCIMGQDGDLIMLGLVTHEPNLVLLREQVVFDADRRERKKQFWDIQELPHYHVGSATIATGVDSYIFNPNFEFLHINVLRDYLAYEFETSNVIPDSPYDLERTIDDFVFMTFFVGNDFLPHIPALDIADEAFDLFFYSYRERRQLWLQQEQEQEQQQQQEQQEQQEPQQQKTTSHNNNTNPIHNNDNDDPSFSSSSSSSFFPEPYLTNAGTIVSGSRLEDFLSVVGSHELAYYDYKKSTEMEEHNRIRKWDAKYGRTNSFLPSQHVLAAKEQSDRARYREMLESATEMQIRQQQEQQQDQNYNHHSMNSDNDDDDSSTATTSSSRSSNNAMDFVPVVSGSSSSRKHTTTASFSFQPSSSSPSHNENEKEGLVERFGNILQMCTTPPKTTTTTTDMDNNDTDNNNRHNHNHNNHNTITIIIDDQDLKGRYYYDKFQFTPFDAEKHKALRKAYVEGLLWNLKYYYEGCVSWDWYYPYHYGPMISDIVNIDQMLEEISFDGKLGKPLEPFQQLMACMPPSQAHHLPKPYRWLMKDPASPVIDFFPKSFTVDMNGKRWPWEAVVLLPFIDSDRLIEATNHILPKDRNDEDDEENTTTTSMITEQERNRNKFGHTIVLTHDPNHCETIPAVTTTKSAAAATTTRQQQKLPSSSLSHEIFKEIDNCTAKVVPFESTVWGRDATVDAVAFQPKLSDDVTFPLAGFVTLTDAPIQSLWRRQTRVNVFGKTSRYKTACLEHGDVIPRPLPSIQLLAETLIGTNVYINYPYLVEAFVTAVSNSESTVRGTPGMFKNHHNHHNHHNNNHHNDKTIRGNNNITKNNNSNFKLLQYRNWDREEAFLWSVQRDIIIRQYEKGIGLTGTGGLILPSSSNHQTAVILSVRPFHALKTMSNGSVVKTYSKFEVDVPLIVTHWSPTQQDPRIHGLDKPLGLEKDPFRYYNITPYRTNTKKKSRRNNSSSRNRTPRSSSRRRRRPQQQYQQQQQQEREQQHGDDEFGNSNDQKNNVSVLPRHPEETTKKRILSVKDILPPDNPMEHAKEKNIFENHGGLVLPRNSSSFTTNETTDTLFSQRNSKKEDQGAVFTKKRSGHRRSRSSNRRSRRTTDSTKSSSSICRRSRRSAGKSCVDDAGNGGNDDLEKSSLLRPQLESLTVKELRQMLKRLNPDLPRGFGLYSKRKQQLIDYIVANNYGSHIENYLKRRKNKSIINEEESDGCGVHDDDDDNNNNISIMDPSSKVVLKAANGQWWTQLPQKNANAVTVIPSEGTKEGNRDDDYENDNVISDFGNVGAAALAMTKTNHYTTNPTTPKEGSRGFSTFALKQQRQQYHTNIGKFRISYRKSFDCQGSSISSMNVSSSRNQNPTTTTTTTTTTTATISRKKANTKTNAARAQLPFARAMTTKGNVQTRLFSVGAVAVVATFMLSICVGGAAVVSGQKNTLRSGRGRCSPFSFFGYMRGGGGGFTNSYRYNNDVDDDYDYYNSKTPPLEFFHGTTTLSFIFQGGIVAAVDSRASLGNFVGSKTTQKVLPINSHILGTMAGGAADCSFWIRKLRSEAQLYEVREGHRMSVARASRLLSNALYENRALQLSVGTMIMGIDEDDEDVVEDGCNDDDCGDDDSNNNPTNGRRRALRTKIYYIDNTGMRIAGDVFAVGSGATFALGILDIEERKRYHMTEKEAIALGIKAIRHATFRDSGSGGFINVYLITKNGWKKVFTEDLCTNTSGSSKIEPS